MAFIVQDDTGNVANANAYISEAFLDSYHADRGNTVTGSTAEKEQAIVRATDYLDIRFTFTGFKKTVEQVTEWPRNEVKDLQGRLRTGILTEIEEATAEYALRALTTATANLVADPTRDATGKSVIFSSVKADVVESSVRFNGAGNFEMPKYPTADRKLNKSGLVIQGGSLVRA